jgi:hypothetical protein
VANVGPVLGRESQFFVGVCFFGPMINEANEPSSACRLRRFSQVETSAPPVSRINVRPFGAGVKAHEVLDLNQSRLMDSVRR